MRALGVVALCVLSFAVQAAETITLGVFAYMPKPVMEARYQPLADYLGSRLDGIKVELKVLGVGEIETALDRNQLDLVLTNPSHYLVLRSRNTLTGALVTQVNREDGVATSAFGGVIVARSGDERIAALADLRGKQIAMLGPYLGGYQAQAYELLQVGVELPTDATLIRMDNHEKVIEAVLAGKVDAGFVRTGVLEAMARQEKLQIPDLRIINRQHLPGFPYIVSTRLYPEWPLVALPHLDPRLTRRIASALLVLDTDHPAAQAAGIEGFDPAADYLPVENLARALRLPPYDVAPDIGVADVWAQYRFWIIALSALLVLLFVSLLRQIVQKRELQALGLNLQKEKRLLADAMEMLASNEERLRTIFGILPVGIVLLDRAGGIVECNAASERMLGLRQAEQLVRKLGSGDVEIYRPDGTPMPLDEYPSVRALTEHRAVHDVVMEVRSPGHSLWLNVSATPLDHPRYGVVVAYVDITHSRQSETRLQLAASVFTYAREGITITDTEGTILDVNEAFTEITGYTRDEVVGKNPRLLNSGRQSADYYAEMWRTLTETGHWYGEVWNRRKNGEIYPEMLSISAVHDASGRLQHYVGLFSDITQAKNHQQQLEHVAHYDLLTDLPNRKLFAAHLQQAMAQAHRRGTELAVVYLDLDGFKAINDRHGHSAGDKLLVEVAQRMRSVLREGDILARLGGDEFAAVLVDIEQVGDCDAVLARLLRAAADQVVLDDEVMQVSASIGYTVYPLDNADADQLLRHADQAMYSAKQLGKNRCQRFDVEQEAVIQGERESVERVRAGLERGEFVLHYQPRVSMRSGEVLGVEALIRWQHPERGLLLPREFLPMVENRPLGVMLGEWVLAAALSQMAAWRRMGLNLCVSVNIAARHLLHAGFVSRLRELLALHPEADPAQLEFEVLETSLLEDMAQASEVMEGCRALGVRFALDDFGTGYSSLTYLKRLPAEVLKIDQSFVRDMLDDPDDLAILDGVLGMATAFRREVIAEGVETVEHGTVLLQLGCEQAQGYGIARPMPADSLADWAAHWVLPAEWRNVEPVEKEDLAVLFAATEHRAWVAALDDLVANRRSVPPPLAICACRFGLWLHDEGARRYGDLPQFAELDVLHESIHALATELYEGYVRGDTELVSNKQTELHRRRDRLTDLLQALLRRGSP
ncbi:EAL domain-containing protein [Propionivibrio limicola]|uniref:EAL domain-containing protein n=1 Tax=Propionivibrio limicola TaxID=167645 RepID=UPI001478788A|nr:EAL domain-containing protein [Propionivibrio limicola]